jgi:hypothetical protein
MPTTFWFYVGEKRYGLWTECVTGKQSIKDQDDDKEGDEKPGFYCVLNNQGKKYSSEVFDFCLVLLSRNI